MPLAEKVRVKREEKQMTQKQLATKSGLTQATISRIESGEVKQLKSQAAISLAKALGVTVDFLIGDMPKMSFDDTVTADKDAQILFRGFEKLSADKRKQVREYVEFLIKQDKSGNKG